MPYSFDTTLPETEEELIETVMAARRDGVQQGRQEGAKEIVDRVDDWVKKKYFSREVERGTPMAEAILTLASTLVHELIHTDLGKIPDLRVRQTPKLQRNRGDQ